MNIISYNIELQMNNNLFNYWKALLTQTRDAYNDCAIFIYTKDINLNLKTVHDNVYDWMREKYPLIPAQGIIKIYKDVISALRSIKANKCEKYKIPYKKGMNLRLDKRMFSNLDINGISLSSGERNHRIKVQFILYKKVIELFKQYKPLDPMIFIRNNRIFLSVPFEINSIPIKDNTTVGVDMGVKRLFVTSDGIAFIDKQYLKERRKIRYLKGCLKSKNTKSAKRHLNKIKHRERNLSKDMCYRAAKTLIDSTNASIIILEDLSKIKKNTSKTSNGFKRKQHNNMLSQVPFYLFKKILTNKAQLVGKQVETVSPTYTSQTDCRNGKRNGKRCGCRYYCNDGLVLDADWNASVNIALRAKHPFTINELPIDGKLLIQNGRCSVNTPNAV